MEKYLQTKRLEVLSSRRGVGYGAELGHCIQRAEVYAKSKLRLPVQALLGDNNRGS